MESPQPLAVLDRASRILEEATSVEEIKNLRDTAEAARTYIRAAKLGLHLQNRAAEIKLQAERKAGQLLADMKLRGGDRKSNQRQSRLSLERLGVSRNQSKRWQLIASISDLEFKKFVAAKNALGEELTASGLIEIARKSKISHRRSSDPADDMHRAPSHTQTDAHPANELLCELKSHCELLQKALIPIDRGESYVSSGSTRRILRRLLHDMSRTVAEIEESLDLKPP